MVIIISDLIDEPDKVIGGLRHFRHKKHEVIVFHTLDRYELDFPFRRMSLFEDMETGDKLLADPLSLHEEYVKRMEDFINAYKEGCFESDIDYIPAETSQPYDLLHVELFSQGFLDLFLRQLRVAVGVQQALLCDQQGALAVHVDRTAF